MCQIPAGYRPDELPFLRISSLASLPTAVMRAISGPQGLCITRKDGAGCGAVSRVLPLLLAEGPPRFPAEAARPPYDWPWGASDRAEPAVPWTQLVHREAGSAGSRLRCRSFANFDSTEPGLDLKRRYCPRACFGFASHSTM